MTKLLFQASKTHSKNAFVYYFNEPFGSFCKLQTFQSNHFVQLLRLFKNSLESKVHMSVPKMENSLSFKQRRLEFPTSTTSFLRNSCNTVTFYSSSPSTFSSIISSERLPSVNFNRWRASCYCLCC